jgi:predicted TIM-barrel fold metal-dependent hydrolase
VADEPALLAVKSMAGADHLLFGSDWPFAQRLYGPRGDPQPALAGVVSPGERQQVDRLNATRELDLQGFDLRSGHGPAPRGPNLSRA